jgi:single-strand DNA-binding protein
MNKVILIGRLTKDPELRKTPTDVSVCQFTIAVNRAFQQQNGERQADFINCIAWRNQAENLAKYMKKGGQIAVDGSIQTRSYDDQNGVRRFVTEVVCNQITFLEAKKSEASYGYNDLSQLEVPPMRESNHNNGFSQESPFGDIKSNYDISSDDLPF